MCLIKVWKKLIANENLEDGEVGYKEYDSMEKLLNDLKNNRFRGIVFSEEESADESIEIRYNGKDVTILVKDINVIYKLEETVTISTKGNDYILYTSLKRLESKLTDKALVRINQSEIYPIMKIKSVEKNRVILDTGEVKKLGRRYAKDVRNRINNFEKIKKAE